MATRYVRTPANGGSDAAAGTSAATAWATLGKLLGASGIQSGETAYVGAGTYRESVTVAMTSAVATTSVIADVDGANTGDAGPVVWTSYTTNDKTAPAAGAPLILAGRDFLTFQGFVVIGGSGSPSCVDASTTNAQNITFQNCQFQPQPSSHIALYQGTAGQAANWLFDRCIFGPTSLQGIFLVMPTSGGGVDYDVNFVVQNSLALAIGGRLLYCSTSGALANKPGGVVVYNSLSVGVANGLIGTPDAGHSTTIPSKMYNCIILSATNGIACNAAGQCVEDFNVIMASVPRTNVSAGANSISNGSFAPMIDLGASWLQGLRGRMFGSPLAGSPFLGFGNQAGGPSIDVLQRPRPAGGSITNSIGYLERHDTAIKETTTFDVTPSVKIAGPGDHDMLIPVNNAATTITIKAQYDTNHAATNKPQVILQTNGEIGVATQTVTMTAAANTWETLTVGPFTPTAKGYVTLRLVSRSAAANGNAFFDTATVPNLNTDGFDYFRYGEPFPALTQNASGGGSTSIPGIIMATG